MNKLSRNSSFKLIIAFLCFFSCEKTKELIRPNDTETLKVNQLSGEYNDLDKDNIRLFLPKYFNSLTTNEYQDYINKIEDFQKKVLAQSKFDRDKITSGNVYYLKDLSESTFVTVKMFPSYYPFTREDSSKLLGMISETCRQSGDKDTSCKKLTASYSGNKKTQVFKGVFEVTNNKINEVNYNTFYIISSNNKSFSIQFNSSADINYDKYIEKIQVK